MITVMMPVYNAERYVGIAIESILRQTFREFEFLIIDDGSTDATASIVRSFQDGRIRYVRNRNNLGIARTLNRGLELAKHDLVARMDADDISLPERLAAQYTYMTENPETGFVSAHARTISETGQVLFERRAPSHEYFFNLIFGNWIQHPTVMFRASVVKAVGGYPEGFAEDYRLWCRLIRRVRFFNIPEVMLEYRHSSHGVSNGRFRGEYDAAEKAQARENVAHYMGSAFYVPDAYMECYRHNVEALVRLNSVEPAVECVMVLRRIARAVARTPGINRSPEEVRLAARRKEEVLLRTIAAKLPDRQGLRLLLRFGAVALFVRYGKRSLRRACGGIGRGVLRTF